MLRTAIAPRLCALLGACLLLMGSAACSDDGPSEAYCEAWDNFQTAGEDGRGEEGHDLLVAMRDEAPEDVAADIDGFIEDFDAAFEAGDPSLLDDEADAERNARIDEFGAEC